MRMEYLVLYITIDVDLFLKYQTEVEIASQLYMMSDILAFHLNLSMN